jgi:hypothetical protein
MELIDKFYNELYQVRGFNYLPQWSSLLGIENLVDYAGLLTNNANLPKFDEEKHTKKDFTGFVKTNSNEFLRLGDFHEESDFAYFEKGKLRYSQWNFNNFYNKVYFKDENFQVLKAYKGNKLAFVHMNSKFKLDDLRVNFSRISPKDISVFLSSKDGFCSLKDVNDKLADNLCEEDFSDYNRFFYLFQDSKMQVFKIGINSDKIFNFNEGVNLIKVPKKL